MSIKTALESEGVDFSEYMNMPEPWDGSAQIKTVNGEKWVSCPYCGKRALKILPTTKIIGCRTNAREAIVRKSSW